MTVQSQTKYNKTINNDLMGFRSDNLIVDKLLQVVMQQLSGSAVSEWSSSNVH